MPIQWSSPTLDTAMDLNPEPPATIPPTVDGGPTNVQPNVVFGCKEHGIPKGGPSEPIPFGS